MADQRSPDEVAGGYINARVGATAKELPTLKIRAARAWRQEFLEALAPISSMTLAIDLEAIRTKGIAAVVGAGPLTQLGTDLILGLVVAYDVGNVLGGRDWLEEHADDAELYALFRVILGVVFPFVNDLRSGLNELLALVRNVAVTDPGLARSIASSFTNGSPAITAPVQPTSKRASTRLSS